MASVFILAQVRREYLHPMMMQMGMDAQRAASHLHPQPSWRKSSGVPNKVFPTQNVELDGHINNEDLMNIETSDIWGYTNEQNHNFALVTGRRGLVVVNVTEPADPTIIGRYWHGETNFWTRWHDARTYDHYLYLCSEAAIGVHVIDLNFMYHPDGTNGADLIINFDDFVKVITTSGVPDNTHNLVLDTHNGLLLRVGSAWGAHFYDVRANPFEPPYIGALRVSQGYFHDAEIVHYDESDADPYRRGKTIMFAAQDSQCKTTGSNSYSECNALDVMDITSIATDRGQSTLFTSDNPDASLVSRAYYPHSEYAHQLWVDTDRQIVYLNDELDEIQGTLVTEPAQCVLFDVAVLTQSTFKERWVDDTGIYSSNHNMFGYRFTDANGVAKKFIVQAHYADGTRIFDITDSHVPVTVGFLDTEPEVGSEVVPGHPYYTEEHACPNGDLCARNTYGNWGTFVFPDGTMVSSSSTTGFFVFHYQPDVQWATTCAGIKNVWSNASASCCGMPLDTPRDDVCHSFTCADIKRAYQDQEEDNTQSCCSSSPETVRDMRCPCNPAMICAEGNTCVDNYVYPTTCGSQNCDEPIGVCTGPLPPPPNAPPLPPNPPFPPATPPAPIVSLWENDFSNPSDWIIVSTGTIEDQWTIETNPSAIPVGVLSPFLASTAANGYLFINSDASGGGDGDGTHIITQATIASPIDLSAEPQVTLSFSHNYRWWQDTRGVRVSGDNGASWTEYEITSQAGYPNEQNSNNPEIERYDVSAVCGNSPQVLIQFYYDDNDFWAWYWAVDDVRLIRGTLGAPPQPSPAPPSPPPYPSIPSQYFEGFEGFAAGGNISTSDNWITWSGDPIQDAQVSVEHAYEGTNSLHIFSTSTDGGPMDVVLLAGIYSGVVQASFWMYVPTGFNGYYNIQESTTPGVGFAMSITFLDGGEFSVFENNQVNVYTGNFVSDTWFQVSHEIDLDNGSITVTLDGIERTTFVFDGASFGGINFYAAPLENGLLANYFIDSISVTGA